MPMVEFIFPAPRRNLFLGVGIEDDVESLIGSLDPKSNWSVKTVGCRVDINGIEK